MNGKIEINTDKLISSIKMRPALYDKENCMYYSQKKFKYKLWREICEEVYRNWNTLTPHEKLECAREVQKRWKNLRTCFTRELASQRRDKLKSETSNEQVKKRKKYEYFHSLLFLLTPERMAKYDKKLEETDSEIDPLETPKKEVLLEEELEEPPDEEVNEKVNIMPSGSAGQDLNYNPKVVLERMVFDEKILDMFKMYKDEEYDEDRQFALSLVTMLKSLNTRKKLEARIQILQLLHRLNYQNEECMESCSEEG